MCNDDCAVLIDLQSFEWIVESPTSKQEIFKLYRFIIKIIKFSIQINGLVQKCVYYL